MQIDCDGDGRIIGDGWEVKDDLDEEISSEVNFLSRFFTDNMSCGRR